VIKSTRRAFLTAGAAAAASTAIGTRFSEAVKAEEKPAGLDPIGGVISVAVTPYREDHSIDAEPMTRLAEYLGNGGTDGIFVAGSTGDMALLTIPEREALITAARKGLGESKKICAGIGDWSISAMADNAKRFQDAGADIAAVMAPIMFFTYSQAELASYFTQIANRSPMPVLLYHHVRVATPIELEAITQIADHPNIIGMKETGSQIERTEKILAAVKGKDFAVMQGNEPFIAESYGLGCSGVLSALAGVWPELFHKMDRSHRAGDTGGFNSAAAKLGEMIQVFSVMPRGASFSYFGQTMKHMLCRRGWLDNEYVRMPGFDPDPEWPRQLDEFLDEREFPKK